MAAPQDIVRLIDVTKTYPGVKALSNVSFDLNAGEVHCLVGENGAGKSTLIRILAGAERPDSGTIEIFGQSFSDIKPLTAYDLGISPIYQETDLILQRTVAENVFLGHEPLSAVGIVDRRQMNHQTKELLERIGVDVAPDTSVRTLSAASRQLVQIAKALSRKSTVLIMDEPTTSLTGQEVDRLFEIINRLKSEGIGIIYISHHLAEILEIGDRVTVLRDGQHVITTSTEMLTEEGLVRHMVGRPAGEQFVRASTVQDDIVLSVRGLTATPHITDISFDLRKGEVLGIAGLVGAGRSGLLGALFGASRIERGEIVLNGESVKFRTPGDAVRHGIGLVPEDRRERGLVLSQSVRSNIILSSLKKVSPGLVLRSQAVKQICNDFVEKLGIKTPSIEQRVQKLSGGNQQKVVLSRWLAAGVQILLLDEPTRGIDVNAKNEIYQLINELTAQGISIIMVSSELLEVLGLSDRILIMAAGCITKELDANDATQEDIMHYAVPASSLVS